MRQCPFFFSWLNEVASVAFAGFWPPLSQFGLASMRHSKVPLITWEVWVKGFNRINSLGNTKHANNMSGISAFPLSIFVPPLCCMETDGSVCFLPPSTPLLNECLQQKSPNTCVLVMSSFLSVPSALKSIKIISLVLGDKSFHECLLQPQRPQNALVPAMPKYLLTFVSDAAQEVRFDLRLAESK